MSLNQWIYIYKVVDGLLIFDRSVSRKGLGPIRAKQRVAELEKLGHEAFFTIGTTTQNRGFKLMKINEDKIAAAVVALGCLVLAGVVVIGVLAGVLI